MLERVAFYIVFATGCAAFALLTGWLWGRAFEWVVRLLHLYDDFLQFLLDKWRRERKERDLTELEKQENSPEAARQRLARGDDEPCE